MTPWKIRETGLDKVPAHAIIELYAEGRNVPLRDVKL